MVDALYDCFDYFILNIIAMSVFLDAKGCRLSRTEGNAIFDTVTGGTVDTPFRLVADSAYDQTFKKIFAAGNEVEGVDGRARLMGFLNGLFYPNAGAEDVQIRKLEYLPNEVSRLGVTSQLGILRFDVACKCMCWGDNPEEEDVKVLDIEMQTAYDPNFVRRLLCYGHALKANHPNNHVVVLAFLKF